MKKGQAEEGFTLVELLIVLLIVSFLTFLPALSIQQTIERTAVDMFFRELSSQITLMQNHAILAGERTAVEFAPNAKVIRFKVIGSNNSSHQPLNREISLADGPCQFSEPGYQTVYFKKDTGNISMVNNSRWRIKFKTELGAYEIVFKLGSGRFDIRKIPE